MVSSWGLHVDMAEESTEHHGNLASYTKSCNFFQYRLSQARQVKKSKDHTKTKSLFLCFRPTNFQSPWGVSWADKPTEVPEQGRLTQWAQQGWLYNKPCYKNISRIEPLEKLSGWGGSDKLVVPVDIHKQLRQLLCSATHNSYLSSNVFFFTAPCKPLLAWVSEIPSNDFSGKAGWLNWMLECSHLPFYFQHSTTQLGKAQRSGSNIFQMQQQFPKWVVLYQLQL